MPALIRMREGTGMSECGSRGILEREVRANTRMCGVRWTDRLCRLRSGEAHVSLSSSCAPLSEARSVYSDPARGHRDARTAKGRDARSRVVAYARAHGAY